MSADLYRYRAVLIRWKDADTCVADIDVGFKLWAHGVELRLMGIQAPDKQPAKQQATDWARDLWPEGCELIVQTVRDAKDREVTTFERWMAHAWDTTGLSIADELVDAGMAVRWDGRGERPNT
jgi:endonuclease YncB( thermonuclease family)